MSSIRYERSPSVGDHWLVEAGELEAGTGIYWSRAYDKSLYQADEPNAGKRYYSGFHVKLDTAAPALAAAYPDKVFDVAQHGSHFYVRRVS